MTGALKSRVVVSIRGLLRTADELSFNDEFLLATLFQKGQICGVCNYYLPCQQILSPELWMSADPPESPLSSY